MLKKILFFVLLVSLKSFSTPPDFNGTMINDCKVTYPCVNDPWETSLTNERFSLNPINPLDISVCNGYVSYYIKQIPCLNTYELYISDIYYNTVLCDGLMFMK